ncbi:MAG: AAA family ATPase [Azoarcus sp.]|jgi:hypothetical protein|nr:AAA family ATPase [Azoarcus sp.]
MKISSIAIQNFLGIREFTACTENPVTLISGTNGAGKSSIQEAIRLALTGEFERVAHKKDFSRLVHEGEKRGFIVISGTDKGQEWTAVVDLPSGKGQPPNDTTLPFVLDAQRFAHLPPNERRAFLLGMLGATANGVPIRGRLAERGCEKTKVEQIAPFLRIGFDAAQKEAAAHARDAKAYWKTVTGGETWGSAKVADWHPAPLPLDAEKAVDFHNDALGKLKDVETWLESAQRELGAANERLSAWQREKDARPGHSGMDGNRRCVGTRRHPRRNTCRSTGSDQRPAGTVLTGRRMAACPH